MTVDLIGWSVCLHVNVQIVLCEVDNLMATSLENFMYWNCHFTPSQGIRVQYVL